MFQMQAFELARLEHAHGDEWHEMHDVTPEHDSAEEDPERQWSHGRIFRCKTCDEEIRVTMPDLGAIDRPQTT